MYIGYIYNSVRTAVQQCESFMCVRMYVGRQAYWRKDRDRVATVEGREVLSQMDADECPSVLRLSRTIGGDGCDLVVAVEGLRYLSWFRPLPFLCWLTEQFNER